MFLLCFVLSESSGDDAETPNAFIFSLNNFEGLAPFGQDLLIDLDFALAEAFLDEYYSAPALVKDKLAILDGHKGTFSPDEVEVFYLDPSR